MLRCPPPSEVAENVRKGGEFRWHSAPLVRTHWLRPRTWGAQIHESERVGLGRVMGSPAAWVIAFPQEKEGRTTSQQWESGHPHARCRDSLHEKGSRPRGWAELSSSREPRAPEGRRSGYLGVSPKGDDDSDCRPPWLLIYLFTGLCLNFRCRGLGREYLSFHATFTTLGCFFLHFIYIFLLYLLFYCLLFVYYFYYFFLSFIIFCISASLSRFSFQANTTFLFWICSSWLQTMFGVPVFLSTYKWKWVKDLCFSLCLLSALQALLFLCVCLAIALNSA